MNDRAPPDYLDDDAPQSRQQRPTAPPQEIVGPTDALSKSALDLGVMRMEVDAAMEHALRHKRNLNVVVEQIEQMALYNDASANRCVYALPRAEKAIIGPSIGFATIVATAWGNCTDSGWWVKTSREEKVVVCGGMFHDLQSNRRSSATVTRRISGKGGRVYSDDMIAVTIQAATSIAQRNAIMKGVPAPVWWPIYERALVIVRGTMATLPERRQKMIASFAQFGVAPARIAMALGVKEEKEITLDHMVMLRGMYEQLRDETITAEEMFDPRRMTSMAFEQVANPLGDDDEDAAGDDAAPGQRPAGAVHGSTAASPKNTAGQAAEASGSSAADPDADNDRAEIVGRAYDAEGSTSAGKQAAHAPGPEKATEPADVTQSQPAASADAKKAAPKKAAAPSPANDAKPAATQADPDVFPEPHIKRTSAEYVAYVDGWLSRAASSADIDKRWGDERKIRNALGIPVDEDQLEHMNKAKGAAKARCKGVA